MSEYLNLFDHRNYVRAGFFRRFPVFLHTTPLVNMNCIAQAGLKPKLLNPYSANTDEMLRGHPRHIVCFYPFGGILFAKGSGGGPFVSLALSRDLLPQTVGLDWSYYSIDNRLGPEVDCEKIIEYASNIAHKHGSIASYEQIPPEHLRIFCGGDNPVTPLPWRPLVRSDPSDWHAHN